jgi:hypothetical protein
MAPRRVAKFAAVAALLILLGPATYFSVRIAAGLMHGYPLRDMDWNHDGTTTVTELVEASDVGRREVQVGGRVCWDYFAYKDGLSRRLVCPEPLTPASNPGVLPPR